MNARSRTWDNLEDKQAVVVLGAELILRDEKIDLLHDQVDRFSYLLFLLVLLLPLLFFLHTHSLSVNSCTTCFDDLWYIFNQAGLVKRIPAPLPPPTTTILPLP